MVEVLLLLRIGMMSGTVFRASALFVSVLLIGCIAGYAGAEGGGAAKNNGAVMGRVLGPDGKPVKGARVVVLDTAAMAAALAEKKAPVPVASGETDKDGIYRIEPVPAGKVRVAARVEKSEDHTFSFAPKPMYVVAGRQVTKIDDIQMKNRERDKDGTAGAPEVK